MDFSAHAAQIEALAEAGKMTLYMALDGRPAALFGLRDRLRADARATASQPAAPRRGEASCHADRRSPRPATALGRALGFDAVHAERAPRTRPKFWRG
ncbi:hypothetical protein ACTTAM_13500 [Rhodobacter capsulatus]|uniref:hypothetical protein n=1 Tax=Rhodobacter capsulatus TaxID=1061 RepID=UPI004028E818